ncbi:MAG: phenylalanine--tRNA ligase subunit alpha [Deltaproteobacteria bacterium]|nr:phenylalanine--tRNA ligase subunit alpha [Deltaproteobacteria bacterium]
MEKLRSLRAEALQKISAAKTSDQLESVRVEYLGKKGKVSEVLAALKDLDADSRKKVGQISNEVKSVLEDGISSTRDQLQQSEMDAELKKDSLDSTAPGITYFRGKIHPIRQVLREAISILELAGLSAAYGPEVEFEDYCFDKLNFKPGHAARDMQATFFVKTDEGAKPLVLRTHTSPVQVRSLLTAAKNNFTLPIRIQAPGRVYRMDDDSTHAPMFHQIEGLAVDTSSTMGDLRAVLDFFFRKFFDQSVKIRFRPSYFPFTEPSAEVDVSCVFCAQKGCRVCKQSGWIEVAGAGMVHPEVFEACGWDPKKVQGWAFGMGVERLAMLKLGVPDLRLFFENRMSFLRGAR